MAKALEWVEGYRAERINKAIADSLPKREGERNRRVFDLARMLKLVYPHAHPGDMGKHFDRWWQWAEPVVRTKDVRESWEEFVHAWFVAEAGPFHMAWDRVDRGTRAILTDPRKNALANLMREMSDIQYETKATTKFSLSYNQIGEFLGMTPPNARRDVALPLKEMGLVEIVEKGKRGPKGPATTWRWIGTAKIDNGQESR